LLKKHQIIALIVYRGV